MPGSDLATLKEGTFLLSIIRLTDNVYTSGWTSSQGLRCQRSMAAAMTGPHHDRSDLQHDCDATIT